MNANTGPSRAANPVKRSPVENKPSLLGCPKLGKKANEFLRNHDTRGGRGQEEDRRKAKETGFDHHMVKPVASEAVEKLLQSLPVRRWARRHLLHHPR